MYANLKGVLELTLISLQLTSYYQLSSRASGLARQLPFDLHTIAVDDL
jgi:hypothetical protein